MIDLRHLRCAPRWGLVMALAMCAVAPPVTVGADSGGSGQTPETAAIAQSARDLVRDAEQVFQGTVTNRRFQQAVADARAIVIFPSLLKAGYILGAESGDGVLLVRDEYGDWSYPAFYQIIGGSFGLQIGVSVTELVLVVRTQRALERILGGNAQLGGDLSIAVGPRAIDTSIDTTADLLSFTTTQGLYAGISVQGSTLIGSDARNLAYYGEPVSARDIVVAGAAANPHADDLRDQLVFYVSAIERDQRSGGDAAD